MSSDKAKMTRAAMLRSARELIVERGIDRLSMDQLALRCEKSKGAVMYHSRPAAPFFRRSSKSTPST